MPLHHKTRFWLLPLLAAWIFDLLFWEKTPGVSAPIWFALALGVSVYLIYSEGKRLAASAWVLTGGVLLFSLLTAVRAEPFTASLNLMFAVGALALLAMTALGGQWLRYSLTDYIAGFVRLGWNALTHPIRLASHGRAERTENSEPKETRKSYVAPVLRGLLLALPVVALLAALLASADPIFSSRLENFLQLLRIENLSEYIYRGVYILVIAYVMIGALLHARFDSEKERLSGVEKPWLTPFIGWIESSVILGCVNLLFLLFVIIQFQYFFGGQANIHIDGYTYAEYARRGFGELVSVAIISLLLFLGLSSVTRREGRQQRGIFSGLGIALVLLVIVMLVSAFQRLTLYESAYGFSRLRTYTHLFMIWLAVLLMATVALEIAQRPRAFGLALLLTAIGFVLTINAINVDGFIARQNTTLAIQRGTFTSGVQDYQNELDTPYLVALSTDSTPTLVSLFENPATPAGVRDQLGGVLACQADQWSSRDERAWMQFHFSDYLARQALSKVRTDLQAYPVERNSSGDRLVEVHGTLQSCDLARWMD